VQLGLHLPYPRLRCRGIRCGVFGHCNSPLLESCCRPSPCGRLSRPRTTTAAPPRPDPIGRRWTQPGHPRWWRGPWREPGRFPCSLIVAGRRRSPAIPPRHRHGYAADLHRGLPDQQKWPARKLPTPKSGRHAPLPAQIRQVRAGGTF
jgi:hypothetical protein